MSLADEFEQHLRAFRRPRTAESYRYAVDKFEAFLDGGDIDPNVLERFARWMIDAEMSPGTVNLVLVGTRQYLLWRRRNGETLPDMHPPPPARARSVVT